MIEHVIPCTPNFTRETLLARFQTSEIWMKQSGEFPRVKTAFSLLRDKPMLRRSESTNGNYASSNRTRQEEDNKID